MGRRRRRRGMREGEGRTDIKEVLFRNPICE
jgi:hypothetical protein